MQISQPLLNIIAKINSLEFELLMKITNKLFYTLQCKICGAIFDMSQDNLYHRNDRCPCCSGKKVFVGINDLNTARPDLTQYLVDKDDGTKFT